jgi:uncharacterized circularly permuted ATP-grasp superfamily protein/uncharacterized alpha-E superfamily protein
MAVSSVSGGSIEANPRPRTALLDGYVPAPGVYDEMVDASGRLRPHWTDLVAGIGALSADARSQAIEMASRLLRENDVTYVAPGAGELARQWRLDLLPLVISASEWRVLEAGLVQRAELLNAVLADLYGQQQLLKSGSLPPALVYGSPEFLVPCHGVAAKHGTYLHLLAFDLGRTPDGRWVVLSNRTQAPAGAGYALENRIVTSRCLPDLFAAARVQRLAAFFRAFSEHLLSLGNRDEHLAVVLSPGPAQAGYFEHAFLGRYLGYPVVEGIDLTVRSGRVYLKTLEGLRVVDLVLRRIDARDCDPLELRVDSDRGVAGLVEAARGGEVVIANALGSGAVENDAILPFLPTLCRAMLGEELRLPSVESWWCGDAGKRAHVLQNLEQLSVRHAFAPRSLIASGTGAFLRSEFDGTPPDRLRRLIERSPHDFVAQERVPFANAPSWTGADAVRPEPMMLRLFVAATKDGYRVMPGGLALSASEPGANGAVVQGDLGKDVWVMADGPVDTFSMLSMSLQSPVLRRSDRDLASRTADDLFWLGRYLERAEGAVRLYRSLMSRLAGEGGVAADPVDVEHLADLLVSQERLTQRRARRASAGGVRAIEQELSHVLFDPESPDGLARVLGNVRRTAECVRERLSADTWRILELCTEVPRRSRTRGIADAIRLLNEMIQNLSAVNGMIQENMTRGYGWRLLDLGRRIERSRYYAGLIRDLTVTATPADGGLLNLLLELADSAMTYRSRYKSVPNLPAVLDLLLADETNPRSLAFQFAEMEHHMRVMPLEQAQGPVSAARKIVLAARTDLRLADVEKLANVKSRAGRRTHLSRLLERAEAATDELTQVITVTYFSHTQERRVTSGTATDSPA